MSWIQISIVFQQDYPYLVQRTELELQDEIIDLDEITLLKDSTVFNLVNKSIRPRESFPSMITAISFESSLDL